MFKYKTREYGYQRPIHSRFKVIALLGFGVAAFFAAPSLAQNYLPAHKGKATLTERNWLLPAQRSDLKMTFDHSFQSDPCPSPSEEEVIETCTVTVELEWMNDGRWNQGEAEADLGDPDVFVFYWEGFGHWSLVSATRDGNSVLGGSTPEGSSFGNGTVDGLTMTVPNSFESGADGPTTYEFVFEYVPGEECDVKPLKVSGHYIHKYQGSLHLWVKPSLSVSAGVGLSGPTLGASASASLHWFFDDHAWQKQLFNPGGKEHKKKLEPDSNVVAHEGCCGKTYETDSSSSEIDMTVTEIVLAESTTVQAIVYPVNQPIQSVSILAWSEDGIQVGALYYEPSEPTWDTIVLDVTAFMPAGSNPGTLHFVAYAREANLTQSELIITSESGGAPGPNFGGDLLKDEHITAPGDLLLFLDLDGRDPQDVLELASISVVDQFGNIVDRETASSYQATPDSVILVFPTKKSAVRTYGNGVIEVLNHDTVQFNSESSQDGVSLLLPVLAEDVESPFNIFAAEGTDSNTLRFSGEAIGGSFMIDLGVTDAPVVIDTTPGESGQSVAQRIAAAINAAGSGQITATLTDTYDIVLEGDSAKFNMLQVDGLLAVSLVTNTVPVNPADINGDERVDGVDLSLLLGSWGSCTNCLADLNGDGVIEGADLAILLGNWG